MLISQITVQALKGRTGSVKIGPLTIFAGPNTSGKSAYALDAPSLALDGVAPGQNATNAGAFALCGHANAPSERMVAELKLSDGRTVAREWTRSASRNGKTSVSFVLEDADDVIPKVDGKVTKATILAALKAEDFRNANAGQQTKIVFELAKSDFDPKAFYQAQIAPLCSGTPELAAIGGIVAKPASDEEKDNPAKWLSGAIDRAGEALREANTNIARCTKAVEQLTKQAAEMPVVQESEIARLTHELAEDNALLLQQRGALLSQQEAQSRAASHRASWEGSLAQYQAAADEAIAAFGGTQPRGLDALKAATDRLAAEMDAARAKYQDAMKAFHESSAARIQRTNAQTALQTLLASLVQLEAYRSAAAFEQDNLAEAQRELSEAQAFVELLRGTETELATAHRDREYIIDRVAGLIEAEEAALHAEKCPHCQTPGTVWRETVLAAIRERLADARAKKEENSGLIGRVTVRVSELQAMRYPAAVTKATERIAACQTALATANAEIARIAPTQTEIDRLRDEIARLNEAADANTAEPAAPDSSEFKCARDTIENEVRAAQALQCLELCRANEPPAVEEVAEIVTKLAEIEVKLSALTARDNDILAMRQRLQNLRASDKSVQDAVDERTRADLIAMGLKSVKTVLETKRKELVEQVFGPLLVTLNCFTANILPAPVEYENGELGYRKGVQWVPFKGGFSGAECAVVTAGLQAALGAASVARVVIVDELDRFDTLNKRTFLENMAEAIDFGIIDQFIGMDANTEFYAEPPAIPLTVIRTPITDDSSAREAAVESLFGDVEISDRAEAATAYGRL